MNNLLGQYSLLSQNLQKYMPCKEDRILVCLKENVFWLVAERDHMKVIKHDLLDMNLKYQIVFDTVNLAKIFRLKY